MTYQMKAVQVPARPAGEGRLIEFFYDFSSPYSYLAATQLEGLSARTGAPFEHKPFVLGAVFKATGNRMPAEVQAKAQWQLKDLASWAAGYGVPFTFPDSFPIFALHAMRQTIAADEQGLGWELSKAIYRAYWGEGRDITDASLLGELAASVGLDPAALAARSESPEVKDRLRANTDDAIRRGAFGAPTFLVGDQLFIGNDRIPFVERAARGERVY